MALAGGLGGDAERHTGEAGHVRLGDLDEFKVSALDLVFHRAVDAVDNLTGFGDVELVDLAIGEEVAVADRHLLDGVLAEGQEVGGGRRLAVLDGEGGDDVALLIGHAVADDGVVVEGLDLEAGAVEGCGAEGRSETALKVALGDLDAAALDLLGDLRGVVRALGGRVAGGLDLLYGHEVGVEVVSLGGFGLTDHQRATRNRRNTIEKIKRITGNKIVVA